MDGLAIRQWLATLDAISYYGLFRIPQNATFDDLRSAFHSFAEIFHPDVHRWRHPNEQAAIGIIYRRGTEAYRVLSDPGLRARYDIALANGILRPEDLIVEMETAGSARSLANPNAANARLVDKLKNAGARPFVLRAEELHKKGDPKQAKVQLVMAMHIEKGNPALEAFAKELDEAVAKKSEDDKRAWQKK
jgi:DnaJ-class molecular chaperone